MGKAKTQAKEGNGKIRLTAAQLAILKVVGVAKGNLYTHEIAESVGSLPGPTARALVSLSNHGLVIEGKTSAEQGRAWKRTAAAKQALKAAHV